MVTGTKVERTKVQDHEPLSVIGSREGTVGALERNNFQIFVLSRKKGKNSYAQTF